MDLLKYINETRERTHVFIIILQDTDRGDVGEYGKLIYVMSI